MHSPYLLHLLLGQVLLGCLRMSATGAGDVSRGSKSPSKEMVHRISSSNSSVVEDEVHEEIYPGTQFRQLSPLTGGFVSDWNRDWFQTGGGAFGSRISQGKCVGIPENMTLCRGIGYNEMRLPNLLEHDSVKEATQQAASWVPLFNVRCHPDTQVFLCSLFAPVCLDRPIWPCKTLCEAVKAGCESRMLKYGFPWPEMLRCEKFPPDNDLCIGMRQENQSDEVSCPACVQPETFESIVDNFCSADFAMKVRLEEAVIFESDMKLLAGKKKKAYKRGTLTSKELRDATFYIENGAQCNCRKIDDQLLESKKTGFYLIMGNRKNDRLMLSFIDRADRNSADMSKAMDAIRKGKICKAGIHIINSEEVNKNIAKEKDSKLPDKNVDTNKGEVKGDGKKGDVKKAEGKKSEGKKEDATKGDGKKGHGTNGDKKGKLQKGNGRKEEKRGDGRKGMGKNDRKKTENTRRSTAEEAISNRDKTRNRKKKKVPTATLR